MNKYKFTFILNPVASYTVVGRDESHAWDLLGSRIGYGNLKNWCRMVGISVKDQKKRFTLELIGGINENNS